MAAISAVLVANIPQDDLGEGTFSRAAHDQQGRFFEFQRSSCRTPAFFQSLAYQLQAGSGRAFVFNEINAVNRCFVRDEGRRACITQGWRITHFAADPNS